MRATCYTGDMAVYTESGVKLTYKEFRHFPDDGRRHEIIDGVHYVSPSPSNVHQSVSRWLQQQLMAQIEAVGTGIVVDAPMDVELTETNIVEPDLVVVATSRMEIVIESRVLGVPDLLVEILSPSNPKHDTELKLKLYEQVQVPEYWIVNPEAEELCCYRLGPEGYEEPSSHSNTIHYTRLEMKADVDLSLVWTKARMFRGR